MRRKAIGLALIVAVISLGQAWADGSKSMGQERAELVIKAVSVLRNGCVHLTDRDRCPNGKLTWVELKFYDEQYPLTLNIVASKKFHPSKIIYLLTASSLNFKSSFFTPIDQSLASYLAQNGYLVVGITPREDNVPTTADMRVMANWGMEKHREDVRKIIRLIQAHIGKPYSVLGHSLGAITALDYAGVYSEQQFRSVMLLDIPSFDPAKQDYDVKMYRAQQALDAYDTLLDMGVYGETSVVNYKLLLGAVALVPNADSGVPRGIFVPGLEGDFTYAGLLHFSLIFTASMPGIITGFADPYLPQEWPMVQANAAGLYKFARNPADDDFKLTRTDVDRLIEAASEIESGIAPMALLRDYTSAISELDDYRIHWAGIQEKVIWINGGLGMGAQTYGANLIRNSGNNHVTVVVVPGYGHVDVIYSETAQQDIWSRLLAP